MPKIISITGPGNFTRVYDVSDEADIAAKVPGYNKHRDGPWPTTDVHREYIKVQRTLYDKNLVRLYQGFQNKVDQRLEDLDGDMDTVKTEAGPEVRQQAHSLYYNHIHNKREQPKMTEGYMVQIYRYWRDIGHCSARKEYDLLWEYVAEKRLPVKLMTVPGDDDPKAGRLWALNALQ